MERKAKGGYGAWTCGVMLEVAFTPYCCGFSAIILLDRTPVSKSTILRWV